MIKTARIFHRRRMLYKSIDVVNLIVIVLMTLCSLYSAGESNTWPLVIFQGIAIAMFLTSFVLFRSNILSNGNQDNPEIYAKAGLIYIMMILGTFPVCLLAYTQGNPSLVSEYGFSAIVALATFSNVLIPTSIIFFISLCFWLEVVFSIEESRLYIKCHELKKTILE